MSALTSKLEAFYRPLREDIFKFSAAMGLDPTDQQAEALRLVQAGHKRISIKSGNGTGKTAFSCVAGGWRTLQAVDALTIVTAPTMRQCRDVWLTEFGRILDNARYPILRKLFQPTKSRIIIGGRDKWIINFVTATQPEAFQGIHEKNLSFISEEASGIEGPIMEAIDGNLTNENSMHIAVGNPNTRECRFFDFFSKDRSRWECLTFSSEDSPLTSKEQIQYIIDTYGRDSDVFRVRVLGEFPNMDPNCIISVETLEKCLKTPLYTALRVARKWEGETRPAKQFGIDYARFGEDESVIARRSGNALLDLKFFSHVEPQHVNRMAMKMQVEAGWSSDQAVFCADANGMGDGVMVDFPETGRRVHEFKTNHNAKKNQEFANKMTEAWFSFAKKCKDGTVLLPNDPMLIQQLSTRQYKIKKNDGRIILESKDEYKARGYGSPDRADAVVMCFYDEVEADTQIASVSWSPVKRFGTGR